MNRMVFFSLVLPVLAQSWLCASGLQPDARVKADVLIVVAHPDDETALAGQLAQWAFDEGKKIAVIYTTRGTGGGNNEGPEQSTAMGAIRELEARQACASFGIVNVWFIDGRDTPGQDVLRSLEAWGHGATLEQMVRFVRLTRPEIIVTWLPGVVAGENHGDHQAAGVLATEAFDLAGDPTVFPAQVDAPREREDVGNFGEGLQPWQAKKIYYMSDAAHPLAVNGPAFDITRISPSKKQPYYRLAAELQTFHRTQGEVAKPALAAIRTGDFTEIIRSLSGFRLIFGKSVVPAKPAGGVFDGTEGGVIAFVPAPGYRPLAVKGVSIRPGGPFEFYRSFRPAHGIAHLDGLVKPEMEVASGSYVHVPLLVENATTDSVTVRLEPVLSDGWKESSGRGEVRIGPKCVRAIQTFFFAPPAEAPATPVTWRGFVNGAMIGEVTVEFTVREWTLPQ